MIISRRRFLRIAFVATGGVAAAYAGYLGPIRILFRRVAFPVLEETPTGPLSGQTLQALLAATEALVDHPVEQSHYADFFRWRSENIRGHRALYEQFMTTVNKSARRTQGCAFAECGKAMRRRILEAAFRVRRVQTRLDRLRVGILDRDWVLFDQYLIRPTVSLFANTDAWRLVGYVAWPGTPRGLERYRQPPSAGVKLEYRADQAMKELK